MLVVGSHRSSFFNFAIALPFSKEELLLLQLSGRGRVVAEESELRIYLLSYVDALGGLDVKCSELTAMFCLTRWGPTLWIPSYDITLLSALPLFFLFQPRLGFLGGRGAIQDSRRFIRG